MSNKYWEKREAEALKHYLKQEEDYKKYLDEIYDRTLDNIKKEIDAFYGRYAKKEGITLAEAKKRVKTADIKEFERKAKRYVKDKNFSKQANEEMRLYNLMMKVNRLEMLKANIGLELISSFDEMDKFMEDTLDGRTKEEIKRQAGILGNTIQDNAELAHSIVNASFHNATFSDRIWLYQDLMRDELGKLLEKGLIQGKNPRLLARDLNKIFNTGKYNCERLMRTELARVQIEAQRQSYIKNGFEMYTFITNTGCCDVCSAIAGKHFKVADMLTGTNAPPMHPNCRCSTAPYSDRKEYDEWIEHLANGGTTEQWNNRIKISSPSSSKSFQTSLKSIMQGKAGLDKRRTNILAKLPNSGDFHRFEKGTITVRDLAYLSAATGHEFALFQSKNEDILVRGTHRNCDIIGDIGDEIKDKKYKWVAHSHVDMGTLSPSTADKKTLRALGQKESKLIGVDGMEIEFDDSLF